MRRKGDHRLTSLARSSSAIIISVSSDLKSHKKRGKLKNHSRRKKKKGEKCVVGEKEAGREDWLLHIEKRWTPHQKETLAPREEDGIPLVGGWEGGGGIGDWGLGCYHTEIIKIAGSIGYWPLAVQSGTGRAIDHKWKPGILRDGGGRAWRRVTGERFVCVGLLQGSTNSQPRSMIRGMSI